jgi:TusE/DsrC/DsvC family sulfur relay protein
MEATFAGHTVSVNDQGYMTQLDQWNQEVAKAIAVEEGIELTDAHWPVLEYLQNEYKNDSPLTIRKVGKSGVIDIKGFYELFPGGPLKKSSRIAGIPKPASCI